MIKLIILFLISGTLIAKTTSSPYPYIISETSELSLSDLSEINQNFISLKSDKETQAAVYIVKSLHNLSLNQFSEKAFSTLELNRYNKSILLVISPKKDKIVFVTSNQLKVPSLKETFIFEKILRPKIKQGKLKEGILLAIDTAISPLSDIRVYEDAIKETIDNGFKTTQGFVFYIYFLFWLWGYIYIRYFYWKYKAKKLEQSDKRYSVVEDLHLEQSLFISHTRLFISLFLTVNPGIFIYVIAANVTLIFPLIFFTLFTGVMILFIKKSGKKYQDYNEFNKFVIKYNNKGNK